MMGCQDEPEHLFYVFRLGSHVPSDNLARGINVRRLWLRGLTGAKGKFLLAATAQNCRKLVRFLACGPPGTDPCAA
jgi:hypothetical protein